MTTAATVAECDRRTLRATALRDLALRQSQGRPCEGAASAVRAIDALLEHRHNLTDREEP